MLLLVVLALLNDFVKTCSSVPVVSLVFKIVCAVKLLCYSRNRKEKWFPGKFQILIPSFCMPTQPQWYHDTGMNEALGFESEEYCCE